MTVFLGFALAAAMFVAFLSLDMKVSGHVRWHTSAWMILRGTGPWLLCIVIVVAMLVSSGRLGVCP